MSTVTLDCSQCGKEFYLCFGDYNFRANKNKKQEQKLYCSCKCYNEDQKGQSHQTQQTKDRMEKLAKIRWTNPCATLQEMGNRLGVSRERIRQMLNKMELPTRHYTDKKMVGCLECGNPIEEGKKFCDRKCQNAYNKILVTCNQCGKLIERIPSVVIFTERRVRMGYKGNFYCDRKCFGRWFGENYGRGTGGIGISSVTSNCDKCGKELYLTLGNYNWRIKKSKRGRIFCSIKCSNEGRISW